MRSLAALGTYGVIAYLVSQGTREIGIRMALGATPERVSRMVLGSGMTVAVLGIIAGLAGSLLVVRLVRSLLFNVAAYDPLTFVLAVGSLIVMAMIAAYVPARRASRIDPVSSLRSD